MMPMASIRACMVVGPTNANPCARSALDRACDWGEVVGISANVRGLGVSSGLNPHTKSVRPPCSRSRTVARALATAARIFARLRTIPASAMRRSTSVSP